MLFLVEIGLTIAAWMRGWRGWALLPLLVGLASVLFIGFSIAAESEDYDSAMTTIVAVGTLIDLIVVGILIYMVVKTRNPNKISTKYSDSQNYFTRQ